MKQKQSSLFLLIALVAAIAIAALWIANIVSAHLSQSNAVFARNHNAPLPVRTTQVESKPVSANLITQANLIETQRLPIFPTTESLVESVHVEVGSMVKKGDPLVTFQSKLIAAELELSRSLMEIAKDEHDQAAQALAKIEKLYKQNLVAQDELLKATETEKQAKAKLINAEHKLLTTEFELSQTELAAPVGGIVVEVSAFAGTVARKNAPVITLSVTNPIYVEAQVAQRNYRDLQIGQRLSLTLDAFSGRRFDAQIVRIGNEVDQRNNTLAVYAKLDNPNLELRPGMAGVASIDLTPEQDNKLRIPAIALLGSNGRDAYVFKVDESNVAHLTKVEIVGYEQGYVGVRSGLSAGDTIVVAGQQSLVDGDRVESGNGV